MRRPARRASRPRSAGAHPPRAGPTPVAAARARRRAARPVRRPAGSGSARGVTAGRTRWVTAGTPPSPRPRSPGRGSPPAAAAPARRAPPPTPRRRARRDPAGRRGRPRERGCSTSSSGCDPAGARTRAPSSSYGGAPVSAATHVAASPWTSAAGPRVAPGEDGRVHEPAGPGRLGRPLAEEPRDAQVAEQRAPVGGEEHVRRGHVAVHQPAGVDVGQGLRRAGPRPSPPRPASVGHGPRRAARGCRRGRGPGRGRGRPPHPRRSAAARRAGAPRPARTAASRRSRSRTSEARTGTQPLEGHRLARRRLARQPHLAAGTEAEQLDDVEARHRQLAHALEPAGTPATRLRSCPQPVRSRREDPRDLGRVPALGHRPVPVAAGPARRARRRARRQRRTAAVSATSAPRPATTSTASPASTGPSRARRSGRRTSSCSRCPTSPDVRAHLLDQDVVWVGGGSVANLLAVWRVHGLDEVMREAWEAGVVLAGVSAGSICWHVGGTTDSFGPDLRPVTDGLALLPYGNGVHYDSEERRRPLLHRLVADGTLPTSLRHRRRCRPALRGHRAASRPSATAPARLPTGSSAAPTAAPSRHASSPGCSRRRRPAEPATSGRARRPPA